MVLLAIDTSNRTLSVALLTEKGDIFSKEIQMERGQGEALVPLIRELLAEAKQEIENLNAIAVAVGPGSFTGVRIGLACAKAFGLALNIPVWGVTNLEAEAYGIKAIKLDSYERLSLYKDWVNDNEPCLFDISLPEMSFLTPKIKFETGKTSPEIEVSAIERVKEILR